MKFDINSFRNSFYGKYLGIIFSILKIVFKEKYKAVIIQMSGDKSCFREFLIMLLFRTLSKTRVILHFHGILQNDKSSYPFTVSAKQNKFQQLLINTIFSQAHKVIFLSGHIKRDFKIILRQGNYLKIEVIENFIDREIPENNTSQFKKSFNVLFVGRLGRYKGFFDIVKIIPGIYNLNPAVHYHFCGTKDQEKFTQPCIDILNEFQSMGIVHMHGPIEGDFKKQIFAEADILVLPSYKEVFPVVILEAMAQGLPVITTKVGVTESVIVQGENGFLIDAGDTVKLSEYILKLSNNQNLCNEIKQNNIQKVRSRFRADIAAEKFKVIIAGLIKDKYSSILYFIQLPPPVHGVAVMNKVIYQSEIINKSNGKRLLELKFSDNSQELNKLSVKKLVRLFNIFFKLAYLLFFHKPKFIYFTIFPTGKIFYRDLFFVFLIKLSRTKPIYHLHGKGIENRINSERGKVLYRLVFNNSIIIHLSPGLLNREIDPLLLKNSKLISIENGIEVRNFPVKEKDSRQIKLLFLSHLIESKGIFILLSAVKDILINYKNVQLYLVGSGLNYQNEEKIRNFIRQYGLTEKIILTGPKYSKEKDEIFYNADIFVYPTLNDAFPLVVLEAMRAGLPVISSNEGALPEIVNNGETGFVVPKNSDTALAEKIELLLKNEPLRLKMGNAGRDKFLNNYSMNIFENKMRNLFEEILQTE